MLYNSKEELSVNKTYKKKILFIGMPDMALVCLHKLVEKGINIIGVVPPAKTDSTNKLLVNTAQTYGLNIIQYDENLNEKDFLHKIRVLNADLAVVASYNKKFPKELLALTRDGFINLHPSKLPDYRGANPYSHVIINGEKESAITLHFMDENFDTGDIVSQYRFKIKDNETMGTLFVRTNEMCVTMLYEALDYYETKELPRTPQKEQKGCKKAPALSFEKRNTFIDWNNSAEEIERFIRGLNPFIGAVTKYKNNILRINSAKVINKSHKMTPGSIFDCNNTLKIACGEGILELESLQYGAYFISTGKDFSDRIRIKKGEMLKSE